MSRPTYTPAKKKLFDAWRALGEHLAINEWPTLNSRRGDLIEADELSEPEKAEFRALQRLADVRTDLLDPFPVEPNG